MPRKKEETRRETLADRVGRLSAQMEAFGKLRESLDMRISMLSERIGELRAMITGAEKDVVEVRARVEKTTSVLEEMKPGAILADVRRTQARVDALGAKIDATDVKLDAVTDELRGLRREVGKFRGIESIIALGDEVKADLVSIEKIGAETRAHSDKVTAIFSDLRSSFSKRERLTARVDALDETNKSLSKSVGELGPKIERGLITIRELEERIGKLENVVLPAQEKRKK